MTSEFLQRQIQRLLDQAGEALDRLDWQEVRARAEAVLRLDRENGDAKALLAAALPPPPPLFPAGPPPDRAPPSLPASFAAGRYQVKSFLGEGSRKRVFLAHDTRLRRDVALSVIKTEGLDRDGLERVQREAQAMAGLGDSPNIVTVFDTGEDDGRPFMVSQYMAGGSVEDLISRAEDRKLPLTDAVRIGEQVCAGLEQAHRRGIVHRDLKPGNIWLTEGRGETGETRGTACVGDFGLAVALDRSRLTAEGMMLGTVAYMAPEQALGQPPGARSDLYSLGCILYEMVTGRPPFVGDEAVAIVTQHLNTPPVAPTWHRPDCPTGLEALVLRLLEKDPAKRPASAKEVAETLSKLGKRAIWQSDKAMEGRNLLSPGVG